jgi:chromosome segregation ATPase
LDEKINIILNDGNNALSSRDDARAFLLDETIKASLEGAAAAATHMVYLPDDRGWVESATEQDVIDSLRYEIQVLQEATASLKKKNDKTAAKLAVTNGGYVKRAEKLESEMAQLAEELQTANQEEAVYRVRQLNEMQGGTDRVEHWNRQIKALRLAEAALQKQFGALRMEKRRRILAAKSATATSSELSTLPHESQLAR